MKVPLLFGGTAAMTIAMGWVAWRQFLDGVSKRRRLELDLLRAELTLRRVPHAHLPSTFFDECVALAHRVSRTADAATPDRRQREFEHALERIAVMAALWRTQPDSVLFADLAPGFNAYKAIFAKYDLSASRV